jgi:hypothetical protein
LITIAPSCAAGVVLKPPPIVPIAVRQAPANTIFFAIILSSILYNLLYRHAVIYAAYLLVTIDCYFYHNL